MNSLCALCEISAFFAVKMLFIAKIAKRLSQRTQRQKRTNVKLRHYSLPPQLDTILTLGTIEQRSTNRISMCRHVSLCAALVLIACLLNSCGSTNPNNGRVLTSISVTPTTADGQSNPNGVVFTATGTFSLPPLSVPLTFAAPYTGQFVVDNPTNPPATIANIVSTGTGTITVQCATGATGTVFITASALANNSAGTVISGNAQLTCP
jgi:hypothetical protein